MTAIYFSQQISDDDRREMIFQGAVFVYTPNVHSLALVDLAKELIDSAFGDEDSETAQYRYSVEEFATILAGLKPAFIHHPKCKEIIPKLLAELGCDPQETYFDLPRMRSSTSDGFLTTGIAYAFHPHRDTWYSAPMGQINWWIPIYDIAAGNAMAFHPNYWDRAVKNNSEIYNYQEWNATQRFNAKEHIGKDTRPQPKAQEELLLEPNNVIIAEAGSIMLFSAAQLHSSVPNRTGKTRFSIDFRCVHRGDLVSSKGAPNVDSRCSGSTIGDYIQVGSLDHLPQSLQLRYLEGNKH